MTTISKSSDNRRFALTSWLVICTLAALLSASGWLDGWNQQHADKLITKYANFNTPNPNIVIVDIDQNSLEQLNNFAGTWPWPRSVHASLLQLLQSQKPKAIVFDIFFTDPDLERKEADQEFIDTLSQFDNVFLPIYEVNDGYGNDGQLISEMPSTLNFIKNKRALPDAKASIITPNAIPSDFWKVGLTNKVIDSDGVERRYRVYQSFSGWRLPSLATRLTSYLGIKTPSEQEFILNWQKNSPIIYPAFSYSQVLVNLTQHIDYPSKNYFQDKIIIVSASAIGNKGFTRTPLAMQQPSAQVLATAIDNLIKNSFLQQPLGKVANFFITALLTLILLFALLSHSHATIKSVVAASFITISLVIAEHFAAKAHILIITFSMLLWLWLYLVINLLKQHSAPIYQRYRTYRLLHGSVSPASLKYLITRASPQLQAQKLPLSLLHMRLLNSERDFETQPPDIAIDAISHFWKEQIRLIIKQHGTLEHVQSNQLTAVWGAPIASEKHATACVSTALDCIEAFDILKKHIPLLSTAQLYIGIHSGLSHTGVWGNPDRQQWTTLGAVPLTAEHITRAFQEHGHGGVLISDATRLLCEHDFKFIEVATLTTPDGITLKLFEPQRKAS